MARAPRPTTLPGRFFVLERDHDEEGVRLTVDDADRSSFMFRGSKPDLIIELRAYFRSVGLDARLAEDCIDRMWEFGAVQGIPAQNRSIILKPRRPDDGLKWKPERETIAAGSWTGGLP